MRRILKTKWSESTSKNPLHQYSVILPPNAPSKILVLHISKTNSRKKTKQ